MENGKKGANDYESSTWVQTQQGAADVQLPNLATSWMTMLSPATAHLASNARSSYRISQFNLDWNRRFERMENDLTYCVAFLTISSWGLVRPKLNLLHCSLPKFGSSLVESTSPRSPDLFRKISGFPAVKRGATWIKLVRGICCSPFPWKKCLHRTECGYNRERFTGTSFY